MHRRLLLALPLVVGIASCGGDFVPARPSVVFEIQAPTCTQQLGFQYLIDHAIVGTDTVSNGATATFLTTAGTREFEARLIPPSIVKDTAAVMSAGEVFHFPVKIAC